MTFCSDEDARGSDDDSGAASLGGKRLERCVAAEDALRGRAALCRCRGKQRGGDGTVIRCTAMGSSANGPKERLLDRGAGALESDALLAIVLRGAAVDAEMLGGASRWIDSGGPAMVGVRPEDVVAASPLPLEASSVLAAALELARRVAAPPPPEAIRGPADVAAIARRELGGLRRERVIVIVCDAVDRPLRSVVVSDGAIDRSLMPVREILNAVLRWDGRAFAVAHNHPCGAADPSDADLASTRCIADAARVVGLRFLGHVVVGDRCWVSVLT